MTNLPSCRVWASYFLIIIEWKKAAVHGGRESPMPKTQGSKGKPGITYAWWCDETAPAYHVNIRMRVFDSFEKGFENYFFEEEDADERGPDHHAL
jgi:hypothetical protein